MSRTYRKSSITEQKSLVKYVDEHMNYIRKRRRWEYHMTEGGRIAYEKALTDYETKCSHGQGPCKIVHQPMEYEFKNIRITYVEYDHEKEVEYATKEYIKYKRDGSTYESNLNKSYKKHCARNLRRFNRELACKIIKDDDSWEQTPYPDTYLGKVHIWDYW